MDAQFVPRREHPLVGKDGRVDPIAWYPWLIARVPKLVDAGTPGTIAVQTINGQHIAWASSAPTEGTWARGDVIWNKTAAVGQPNGWRCTVAGTPGTWAAMANL